MRASGQFNVKVLVIVNESPWGGSLAVTALRLARAMPGQGLDIAAVYFRNEGVYQALAGRAQDSGTPCLRDGWLELSRQHGAPLLLCSSAAQRRLPGRTYQRRWHKYCNTISRKIGGGMS